MGLKDLGNLLFRKQKRSWKITFSACCKSDKIHVRKGVIMQNVLIQHLKPQNRIDEKVVSTPQYKANYSVTF